MRRTCAIVIVASVLLGSALRFARLSSVPVALYCDEAFQGYEAYCLLRTGADSRGVRTPLFFNVFDLGWQEPLYVYLTIIPVGLLGTTEGAARMVAAAAGTLALLAVAGVAFHLGGGWAAASACALMAVSPWAFHFSRVGFQATLMPLFLAAGAAALLKGARDSSVGWLLAGSGTLAAALYTYVASRLLVPLILAGFAAAFLPSLRRLGWAKIALVAALALILALPVVAFSITPAGTARYRDVGLSSSSAGAEAASRFLGNYVSYFSPHFLIGGGDPNPRHSVRGFGMLHPHDVLFLVAGIAAACLRRRPADSFVLWWLAVSPVPAALAADPGHAVRALGALPPLYALAGAGAAALFTPEGPLSTSRRRGRAVLVAALAAAAVSSGAYLYHYFLIYPVYSGPAWQYGLKEAYAEIETLAASHDSIYVTRAEDFPFIHRLYLFAFPPEEYQRHRLSRTKYLFDEPVFYRGGLIPGRANPLFLLKPSEVPGEGIFPRKVIPYPDDSPAFVLAW